MERGRAEEGIYHLLPRQHEAPLPVGAVEVARQLVAVDGPVLAHHELAVGVVEGAAVDPRLQQLEEGRGGALQQKVEQRDALGRADGVAPPLVQQAQQRAAGARAADVAAADGAGARRRRRRDDGLQQRVQRRQRARRRLQKVPELLEAEPLGAVLRLELRHHHEVLLEALAERAGEGVHDEAARELRRLRVRPLPQLQVLLAERR